MPNPSISGFQRSKKTSLRYVFLTVGSAGGTEEIIQIGKELLKPELPLTLRLIGLRVTKLKDLRADAESKARGIKRVCVSSPTFPLVVLTRVFSGSTLAHPADLLPRSVGKTIFSLVRKRMASQPQCPVMPTNPTRRRSI